MARQTDDEIFWQQQHPKQAYAEKMSSYEHYAPAYRTGSEAARKHAGKQFDEIEDDIALEYERNRAGSPLPWDQARPAVKAAWDRIGGVIAPRDTERGIRSGI